MFIFDPNRYAKDPGGISGKVTTMIEELGGTVRASRLWNEQRLAYPIKGHRKGSYWLTYCHLEPEKVTELNRACQLNDNILRHLVIKIDVRLEETLIAHALGKTIEEEKPAATEEKPKEETAKKDGAKDDKKAEPVAVSAGEEKSGDGGGE